MAVAVAAAAWLGYYFLLSWMDEGFSRFLGKQGKLSPLIVGAREEELVLYRG